MTVPVLPSRASAARAREVMSAVPPWSLFFTNSMQDSTFGSMLPGANWPSAIYFSHSAIVMEESSFWSGLL